MTEVPAPEVVRRLDAPDADALVDLVETFEELQTVLRCCERLVAAVAEPEPDGVLVEAVWTMALASYARCFTAREGSVALGEGDLTASQPGRPADDVLEWHRVLLRLRDHHVDPARNPRERFTAGVAQGPDGRADGIAVTSARQPLVDDLTVRQTGAIAYGLSALVDARIGERQEELLARVRDLSPEELAGLDPLDLADPATAS
ncbi:hypothetical protein [Nocardioides donggukensis]|uniref:Uncharacterized protein n=1 Tax=Nocardioides donggukensis TaxID=2774019 RepID=A0A927PZJ3_9ACTN|nr:hypothetical protein [Nocardioides donggukensis]MBD8870298.1 hypothetical protein [Nocardioides donggukensis]